MATAFDPYDLGGIRLSNRIVMAPMTRSRAHGPGATATDLMATYYAQRASAGLIVAEGTQPSAVGQGYPDTPGIHTAEQVAAWRKVTDAVHARSGVIFLQLMHTGRVGHPDLTGLDPVGPSAVAAKGQIYTHEGPKDFVAPQQLTETGIAETIADFSAAARRAIEAGFDGVELHGANGYLIHQFLAPGSNHRTDEYGGSPENRVRFALEVTRAVADAIGADRVGIRISPAHNIQGATEEDPADVAATYRLLVEGLAPLGLAYLSILADPKQDLVQDLRRSFGGVVIANDGFGEITTRESAQEILDKDLADAVAVGRLFLANPDLPARWRTGAELNQPDPDTFYGGGAEGYTDYPFLDD